MLQKLLLIVIMVMFFSHLNGQTFTQEYPQFETSHFPNHIVLDSTIISATSGPSSLLLHMDREGHIVKTKDLTPFISKIYTIKKIGNHIYVGGKISGNSFSSNMKLLKLDIQGNIVWQKKFTEGIITSISAYKDKILVGGTVDISGPSSYASMKLLDVNGNVIASKEYAFYTNNSINDIIVEGDNIYLLDYSTSVGQGLFGLIFLKVNSSLDLLLRKDFQSGSYKSLDPQLDCILPMEGAFVNNNQFVIAVAANNNGFGSLVILLNTVSLTYETRNLTHADNAIYPMCMTTKRDGFYYIAGIYFQGSHQGIIEKRKANGDIVWSKKLNSYMPFDINVIDDYIYGSGMSSLSFPDSLIYHPMTFKMSEQGKLYEGGVSITAKEYNNCTTITNSTTNVIVNINNTNYTINNSPTTMDLKPGKYAINYTLPNYYTLCNPIDTVTIQNSVENLALKLNPIACTNLNCGITSTELIKGQPSKLFINYHNDGLIEVPNAYLIIHTDIGSHISELQSSWIKIDEKTYKYELGKLSAHTKGILPLTVSIPIDWTLYATTCIDVNIYPILSCNGDASSYQGPNIEIEKKCTNNKAEFTIVNNGGDMTNNLLLTILKNGYVLSEEPFKLKKNEFKKIAYNGKGDAYTIVVPQDKSHPVFISKTATIEGCGVYDNGTYTRGIAPFFNNFTRTDAQSSTCLEVRENVLNNKIYSIPSGVGYYNTIKDDHPYFEYALVYKHESNESAKKLVINLSTSSNLRASSVHLVAQSHPTLLSYINHALLLTVENINLTKGQEYHFRFKVDHKGNLNSNRFILANARAFINDGHEVNFQSGFHNVGNEANLGPQSPHSAIENGQILGRQHARDFYSDLILLRNKNKLMLSHSLVAGEKYETNITIIDANEKVIAEKEFNFTQGGSLITKAIQLSSGDIILLGTVQDKERPITFNGLDYTCIVGLTEQGEKKWEKVFFIDAQTNLGGTLNGAFLLDNDRILITGTRLKPQAYSHYAAIIDRNGNLIKLEDLDLSGNLFINQNGNAFTILGVNDGSTGLDHKYITFNKAGAKIKTGTIPFGVISDDHFNITAFELTNEKFNACGFKVTVENNAIVYTPTLKTYDKTTNEIISKSVMQDGYYVIPRSFIKKGDTWVLGGEWALTSSEKIHSFLMQVNAEGEVEWLYSQDYGSREFYKQLTNFDNKYYLGFQTQSIDNYSNLQFGYFGIEDTNTGIKVLTAPNSDVKIYPNPTSGLVNVYSPSSISTVSVFSSTGHFIESFAGDRAQNLDLSTLSNGQYILKITMSNQQSISKIITKIGI